MKIKKFVRKNPLLVSFFVIVLCLFLYQHSTGVSWDFSVYVLNARYFLGFGSYFEWLRPPLTSLLIAFFGAMIFSEYFFIAFVATLHLFSSYKLAKKLKVNPSLFYLLSLTPFVIGYSFQAGTELLSLALVQLSFAYLSGLPAGLSMLTRYTNAVYSLSLFVRKDFNKALKQLLIAALIFSPWLLFNFFAKGDPLFSIINQYANNIGLRDYAWKPFDLNHFFQAVNYLLPFFVAGLFVVFRRLRKVSRFDLLMVLVFIYELISYNRIPLKLPRYLFMLSLPAAYFTAKLFKHYRFESRACFFFFGLNILLIPFYITSFGLEPVSYYESAFSSINSSCMTLSNSWVFLNYFGINSAPFPRAEQVTLRINEGYQLVLFKNLGEPDYVLNNSFLSQFPVKFNQSRFIILWDDLKCIKPYTYDLSYLEGVNKTISELYGYEFTYTFWDIIK